MRKNQKWAHHEDRKARRRHKGKKNSLVYCFAVMRGMKIGKYEVLEPIGKGGMGVVYKAYDPVLDREVALKTISLDALKNPAFHDRFYREARAAGKLRHPNIVTIYELGEEYGLPHIVMEYLPGTDLQHLMREERRLSFDRKIEIMIELCHGLAYAHEAGVVHRDIKPSNIHIGTKDEVKIVDFGIARILASTSKSSSGMIFGSVSYMSPEQVNGKTKMDARSDIFSAGIILYELVNGRKPFEAKGTANILHRILNERQDPIEPEIIERAPGLLAILDKALSKVQNQRYANADEMARDLRSL